MQRRHDGGFTLGKTHPLAYQMETFLLACESLVNS